MGRLRSRAPHATATGQKARGRVLPRRPPGAGAASARPHAGSPSQDFALAEPPARERVMVGALVAAWLLLSAAACAQREQDFYDFKAVNIRGKLVSLEKYRGSVSVRPWGRGAARAGPVAGTRDPAGVAPRGPRSPALVPTPSGIPTGVRRPQILSGVCPADYVARPPARSETRNSPSRRRLPSQRLWAVESGLSQRLRASVRPLSSTGRKATRAFWRLCLSHPQFPLWNWDCC